MKKSWVSTSIIVLGNILYALTVKLFLLPAGLITGGTTGIAIFINRITGMQVSFFVLLFNVLMLIIGRLILGRKFALTTIISTFIYPTALHIIDLVFPDIILSKDPMLCTIFSGCGIGLSLAMVIREGASTGGMDIPPLILQKLFGINVSFSLYAFDCLILLLQASGTKPEMILYGILLVMIYSLVLDRFLLLGSSRTEVKVISKKADQIRKEILDNLDRGVTILHGEGGFSHTQEEIILTIISNRQLPVVEKMIRNIDEEAFLIVSRVSEVRGRGFTMNKQYKLQSK